MDRQQFQQQIEQISQAIEALYGDVDFLFFEPLASEQEIIDIERKIDFKLPSSFKTVLQTISSNVYFYWQLPDELFLEQPNEETFCGHLHWDLFLLEDNLLSLYQAFDSSYDAQIQNKLPFLEIRNGDFFAFDIQPNELDAPVVYLSPSNSTYHNVRYADNFIDFIEKGFQIGFAGAEAWQWYQFISRENGGIDGSSSAAKLLRKNLGIDF